MNTRFSAHRDTETQRFLEKGKHCVPVSLCTKILLAAIVSLFTSCEEAYDDFPRTEVRFTCSLQQAPYSSITSPGQFLTVTKDGSGYKVQYPSQKEPFYDGKQGIFLGFGGLIIGQPVMDMSVNGPYAAYDRACPVEAEDLNISRLNINAIGEATCPKCKTVYDLNNGGFPKQGTGKKRLKTYTIYTTNTATGTSLVVRN